MLIKIFGLIVVVFVTMLISMLIGLSEYSSAIGAIIGASSYVLMFQGESK